MRAIVYITISLSIVLAACGGDGGSVETRTVGPGDSGPLVNTGIPELDATLTVAMRRDRVGLAGLTGYQQIACSNTPQNAAQTPQCRENEPEGTSVEVLPVTNCSPSLVRPEQAPDAYNIALAGSGADATAVAIYRPNEGATRFGSQYVGVIRTNAPDEGDATGAALYIREGRVVMLETDCDNLAALYAADRVGEWILEPSTAQPTPTAAPTQ